MKENQNNTDKAVIRNGCLHLKLNQFCTKCGVIMLDSSEICLKQIRYEYSLELYPTTIFKNMMNNIGLIKPNQNAHLYLSERYSLITLLKDLNIKLRFRSETFFLSVYYMDLIFHSEKIEMIDKKELYAVSCLLLAAKFTEKDPNIPDLYQFQSLTCSSHKSKLYFSIDDLRKSEVTCLKTLDYKLNYFTIYHFITFFFTHGIVTESEISNKDIRIKIIENIYSFARDLLDLIIDEGKEFIYHNNYHIACAIILYARDAIFTKFKFNYSKDNVLNLVYSVNWTEVEQTLIIVKLLYDNYKQKKNNYKTIDNPDTKKTIPSLHKLSKEHNRGQMNDNKEIDALSDRKYLLNNFKRTTELHGITTTSNNVNSYKFGSLKILNKTKESVFKKIDMLIENSKPRALSLEKELKKKIPEKTRKLSNIGGFLARNPVNEIAEEDEFARKSLNTKDEKLEIINDNNLENEILITNNLDIIDLENNETELQINKNMIKEDKKVQLNLKSNLKNNLVYENKDVIIDKESIVNHRNDQEEDILFSLENEFKLDRFFPQSRARIRNDSFPNFQRECFKEKEEDILYKTKKIFGNNTLLNKMNTNNEPHNIVSSIDFYKEKGRNLNVHDFQTNYNLLNNKIETEKSKENNSSTIIINNNININTYVSKNYFPGNTINKSNLNTNHRNNLEVNYNSSIYKNELLSSANQKSQNNYTGLNSEKEIIRKKIDSEINSKNKLTSNLMNNYKIYQDIPVKKFDNKFEYEYQKYGKLDKNKEASYNMKYELNSNPTSNRISSNFAKYDKYYKNSTSGIYRFEHNYDYLKNFYHNNC